MYNILKSVSHCLFRSRDEDGIGWSHFSLESAPECPHVYFAPPLLRDRFHLVRDIAAEKEFDIAI